MFDGDGDGSVSFDFTSGGAPSGVPSELYVEGLAPGTGTVTVSLIAPTETAPSGEVVAADAVNFTVVDVNLTIWDGVTPDEVSEAEEESRGAFTVANLNDTDGDTVADWHDTSGVFASPTGREEDGDLDLMQLRVYCAGPTAGTVTLYVDPASDVRLWEEKTKVTPIPITPCEGATDGTVTFPVSGELDETIYVELIGVSVALRDYTIRLRYYHPLVEDTVKATAVWTNVTAVARDLRSAADVLADPTWSDMEGPPKDSIQFYGGVGLRPIQPSFGVKNVIFFQFTVYPQDVGSQPGVVFDAARDAEGNRWSQASPGAPWVPEPGWERSFEEQVELPNDDANDAGESAVPTADDHFYCSDATGPAFAATAHREISKYNFREWLRVSFDGNRPTGDSISGSRCSDKYLWSNRHTLLKHPLGVWERTTGDDPETDENRIGEGHRDITPP